MKLTSYIRFDSLILPILFFFSYDTPGASGSVSGIAGNVRRAYPDDMDGSLDAHTGNICRMRNYRSPDAQLQIAGCATTDHRMRNYRSPDAQLQITGCATTDHRMRTLPSRKRCRKPHGGRTEKRKISAISGDQTGLMT